MGKVRRHHSSKTKLEGALAMIKGQETVAELCTKYGVNQSVLQRWKKELLERGETIFAKHKKKGEQDYTHEDFQRKIGELTMEIDFLKKVSGK